MRKRFIGIGILCIVLAFSTAYSKRNEAITTQEIITRTIQETVHPNEKGTGGYPVLYIKGYSCVGLLSGNGFTIPLENAEGDRQILPAQEGNDAIFVGNMFSFSNLSVELGDELSLMDMSGYTRKFTVTFMGRTDSTRIGDADLALFRKTVYDYDVVLCRESE